MTISGYLVSNLYSATRYGTPTCKERCLNWLSAVRTYVSPGIQSEQFVHVVVVKGCMYIVSPGIQSEQFVHVVVVKGYIVRRLVRGFAYWAAVYVINFSVKCLGVYI